MRQSSQRGEAMSDIREIVRRLPETDPAEPIGKLRTGTAGIAQKIQSYNLAFQLAWKHISEDQRRRQPNIAQRLHDSIRRQLKEGATEGVFIASDALKDVERN
jgi:hypothetical protein